MLISEKPKTILAVRSITSISDDNAYRQAYMSVSSERKIKTDKLRQYADKCRSLVAELLLRECIKEFCGRDIEPEYEYGFNKKPYLQNSPDIFFNISHSGDYVICAVSEHEVGCDIQRIGEAKGDEIRLAERFFTEKEVGFIKQGFDEDEKKSRFYDMWVLKESFMKACGAGMKLALNDFEILVKESDISLKQSYNSKNYKFYMEDIAQGYKCAICIEL